MSGFFFVNNHNKKYSCYLILRGFDVKKKKGSKGKNVDTFNKKYFCLYFLVCATHIIRYSDHQMRPTDETQLILKTVVISLRY